MKLQEVPARKRYRTPSKSVVVDVSLDEFDTEELRDELARRSGQNPAEAIASDDWEPVLRDIRTLILCGQKERALRATEDFLRDVLGTAL